MSDGKQESASEAKKAETEQAFLTEAGLKRHYELNGHNLRKHRDYVVHCFRNPEIKELFEALRAFVEDESNPR